VKPPPSQSLLLASSSPRRGNILDMLGIAHTVVEPVTDEENPPLPPVSIVRYLSRKKAESVAPGAGDELVLSADTVVVLKGGVIGKPVSRDDAKDMLTRLSGEWHNVYTGVTLLDPAAKKVISGEEMTSVKFRELDGVEIEDYVSTGEPFDKAGGYGIQGRGSALVERIDGCYYNVVGLPVARMLGMLKELGYRYDRSGIRRLV